MQYTLSPYRWLILFAVTICGTTGQAIFITLHPLKIPIAEAFDQDSVFYVNLAVMIFALNMVPMTFASIWMFTWYSVTAVLRFAMTLMMVGATFRAFCYETDNFWPVYVGSFLCSMSSPFFITVQSIIANKWFGDHERSLATALQNLALPIGQTFSGAFSGFWFSSDETNFKGEF